jgi:hypothetical protein
MTEEQWWNCRDPFRLLECLRTTRQVTKGKAGRRKLRLFGCACCRRALTLCDELEDFPAYLEHAERVAEGSARPLDLEYVKRRLPEASWWLRPASRPLWEAAWSFSEPNAYEFATRMASLVARAIAEGNISRQPSEPESDRQVAILRDIFTSPSRLNVAAASSWQTETVRNIARSAYRSRKLPEGTLDEATLAVLADALEEAGCANAEILEHCRGPGPHVRGCWVVDLLLAKE